MTKRRTKGDGSISQRHDAPTCPPLIDGHRPPHRCQGRWVAVLNLGYVNGRRQRKVMYGATQKEARIKLETAKKSRAQSAKAEASLGLSPLDTLWDEAMRTARDQGETVTEVIIRALVRYVSEHPATEGPARAALQTRMATPPATGTNLDTLS